MHLDSNEDIEDKDDIPEDANTKAVVVSEDQPQAEDLSHKSSRSESPATATSASNLKARYHPYCHSEILIKSEWTQKKKGDRYGNDIHTSLEICTITCTI